MIVDEVDETMLDDIGPVASKLLGNAEVELLVGTAVVMTDVEDALDEVGMALGLTLSSLMMSAALFCQ